MFKKKNYMATILRKSKRKKNEKEKFASGFPQIYSRVFVQHDTCSCTAAVIKEYVLLTLK